MSECSHNCNSCQSKGQCSESLIEAPNDLSSIKRVVGVVSGKGGVGKSMVTSLLAVLTRRLGYRAGIMDADITGPSIPKSFGLKDKAVGNKFGLFPVTTKTGIDVMSLNLLLDNETDPVVWRGPVIAGTVKQFWHDVIWTDLDVLYIDMPPGTGDVPLTVFQSIPLDGIIVVTSPQDLVSMIVKKAINMAKMLNIPVLGLVENYSYVLCPDCKKEIHIFGESHIDEIAKEEKVSVLAKLPVDPKIASLADNGLIEDYSGNHLDKAMEVIKNLIGEDE